MIVKWTTTGPLEMMAEWQGKQLRLVYEVGKWRVYVDGVRARQQWITATQAMHHIDTVMDRIVTRLAGTAQAVQRDFGAVAAPFIKRRNKAVQSA